jgi:hypothetical protein
MILARNTKRPISDFFRRLRLLDEAEQAAGGEAPAWGVLISKHFVITSVHLFPVVLSKCS